MSSINIRDLSIEVSRKGAHALSVTVNDTKKHSITTRTFTIGESRIKGDTITIRVWTKGLDFIVIEEFVQGVFFRLHQICVHTLNIVHKVDGNLTLCRKLSNEPKGEEVTSDE